MKIEVYVDIVSYAGAIDSVVISSKHCELLASSHSNLRNKGHQIVGGAIGILPDVPGRMSADRVEVAEKQCRPTLPSAFTVL